MTEKAVPADLADTARRLAERLCAPDASPLDAVVATRDLARAVDRALRAAVERARVTGHTWQEIGDVLGSTRQAAFQRFGRPLDPRTGTPMADKILPGAAERAAALVADLTDGRWAEVRRDFDETVAAGMSAAQLAATWAQTVGLVGRYEGMGEPVSHQAGDHTVVDIPLSFEAGELTARVAYDGDGKVAGLFLRRPDTA